MEDNYIAKELSKDDLDIIIEYTLKDKLHIDFLLFPITTYDMVQMGYPTPNYGAMLARGYRGTNSEGQLLPGDGMWCKVSDIKLYIEVIVKNLTS